MSASSAGLAFAEASPRSISSILAVRASAIRASARRAACSERLFSHMACIRDLSLEVGDSGRVLVPLLGAVVEGASCDPLLVLGSTKVVEGVGVGTRGTGVGANGTVLT